MVTFETIYGLNFFTAAVHAVSALVIFVNAFDMQPITRTLEDEAIGPYLPAVCFQSGRSNAIPDYFFVKPQMVWELKAYTATLVTLFFLLSAVFQTVQGGDKSSYRKRVESNGTNVLRYVEYSFSVSLMVVCIATTLMIFDIFTHVLVFTCTFACMSLWLVSDCLRANAQRLHIVLRKYPGIIEIQETFDKLNRLKWTTHYMGWLTFMKLYIFVFGVAYFRTVNRDWDCLQSLLVNTPATPEWVHAVIISQFLLFSCFGLIQFLQFRATPDGTKRMTVSEEIQENMRIGITTEFSFIMLSLTAKSILGWVVAGNVLFVKM